MKTLDHQLSMEIHKYFIWKSSPHQYCLAKLSIQMRQLLYQFQLFCICSQESFVSHFDMVCVCVCMYAIAWMKMTKNFHQQPSNNAQNNNILLRHWFIPFTCLGNHNNVNEVWFTVTSFSCSWIEKHSCRDLWFMKIENWKIIIQNRNEWFLHLTMASKIYSRKNIQYIFDCIFRAIPLNFPDYRLCIQWYLFSMITQYTFPSIQTIFLEKSQLRETKKKNNILIQQRFKIGLLCLNRNAVIWPNGILNKTFRIFKLFTIPTFIHNKLFLFYLCRHNVCNSHTHLCWRRCGFFFISMKTSKLTKLMMGTWFRQFHRRINCVRCMDIGSWFGKFSIASI